MADQYRKASLELGDIPYKPALIPRREGKREPFATIAAAGHRRPMKADNGGEVRVRTREEKEKREGGDPPSPPVPRSLPSSVLRLNMGGREDCDEQAARRDPMR